MPDASLTPDRQLAVASAPAAARRSFAALLGLDQRMGEIVRAARDPMIGQMRLTWWYEALGRLDSAPAPAEPLLREISAHILADGLTGAMLAGLIEGWEMVLDGIAGDEALAVYAQGRGGLLFEMGAAILGSTADARVRAAGQAWALVDLANGASDERVVRLARSGADRLISDAFAGRWPSPVRPLGILAKLAILAPSQGGAMSKALNIFRFRAIGR